jgi:hypothetical protein
MTRILSGYQQRLHLYDPVTHQASVYV